MRENKPKIITVVGPTSSGKSDIAVLLAQKVNGEIISADSRQVYKGMNIGTGKVTKKETAGIPHYLLDVVSPKKIFTVADYKELAERAIQKILSKNKIPILCGGTGLYIRSVIDGLEIPDVPPNNKLRKDLYQKNVEELFLILKKIDPRRAKEIDTKNPVRLVRAIEIAKAIGKVPELKTDQGKFDVLEIGLTLPKEKLKERIKIRLVKRIKAGMVAEVKKLRESGVSWKRLNDFGLEYRYISKYLKGELSKKEAVEKLNSEINKYAKRQMTWFKKDKRIHWFDPSEKEKMLGLAEKFVSKN